MHLEPGASEGEMALLSVQSQIHSANFQSPFPFLLLIVCQVLVQLRGLRGDRASGEL